MEVGVVEQNKKKSQPCAKCVYNAARNAVKVSRHQRPEEQLACCPVYA